MWGCNILLYMLSAFVCCAFSCIWGLEKACWVGVEHNIFYSSIVKETYWWIKQNKTCELVVRNYVHHRRNCWFLLLMISFNVPCSQVHERELCYYWYVQVHLLGECNPLSSWTSHAYKTYLLFLSCITKMGQNFINSFSRVDIHHVYYMVKMVTKLMVIWN